MVNLTTSNFKETIEGQATCLVKFYADWCGPCKTLQPTLDSLESTLGINVFGVDIDANEDLGKEFSVRSLPTVILFKNGVVVGSPVIGAKGKQVYLDLISSENEIK